MDEKLQWIGSFAHGFAFFNSSPGRSTEILNRSAGPAKSAHQRIRPAIDRGLDRPLITRVQGLRPPLKVNFKRLDQRGWLSPNHV
jgi:hypothetical protein